MLYILNVYDTAFYPFGYPDIAIDGADNPEFIGTCVRQGIAAGSYAACLWVVNLTKREFFLLVKRQTRDVTHAPQLRAAIIFTDVQSSTKLWGQNTDAMRKAMDTHHHTIRQVIAKHKVYEVKTIGDSFMIACESADVAVRVCNDIQSELLTQVWPAEILDAADACVEYEKGAVLSPRTQRRVLFRGLRVRIGIEIGNPKVVLDEVSKGYDYYGDEVNTAARVESVAYGGQTLVTKTIYDELSPEVRF